MALGPNRPNVVLAIAAHADDIDWWAGGTLAQWIAAGTKVYLLVLTDGGQGAESGNLSTAEVIDLREYEQRLAAKLLGYADVYFARFRDGRLADTKKVRREIVRTIRMVRPDTVITWDPSYWYCTDDNHTHTDRINHPDHRAAGAATLAAVYPLARNHLSFPKLLAQGYEPHKVKTLLLINPERANWHNDISSYLELKTEAAATHQSQKILEHFDLSPTEAFVWTNLPA